MCLEICEGCNLSIDLYWFFILQSTDRRRRISISAMRSSFDINGENYQWRLNTADSRENVIEEWPECQTRPNTKIWNHKILRILWESLFSGNGKMNLDGGFPTNHPSAPIWRRNSRPPCWSLLWLCFPWLTLKKVYRDTKLNSGRSSQSFLWLVFSNIWLVGIDWGRLTKRWSLLIGFSWV